MRTASAAARTPVDCSELHQQPVAVFLRPTFIQQEIRSMERGICPIAVFYFASKRSFFNI